MGYGKIAVDTLRWDNAGTPTDLDVGTLATPSDLNAKANVASPSFTGDVTLTGDNYNVVFDASDNALEFATDAKATFGAGSDLEIYFDGSNSFLLNNTGNLYIQGDSSSTTEEILIRPKQGEQSARFIANGGVEIYHDNSKKFETTTDGVTVNGSVTDDKGDLRKIIQNYKTAAYTLIESDSGKHILTTTGTVTIPANVFSSAGGDAITIVNHSGSDITIAQGSGLTMYNTADGSTGDRILAGRGMCTVLFNDVASCYISGAGLS